MISMPATALLSGAALKERRVRNGLGDAAVTGPPQTIDVAAIGLSKSYDAKAKVLDNISFAVPTGEAVALIGRNGAGKSTLLRCCVGLAKIDEGSACLFGEELSTLPPRTMREFRARVGFVFQQHNLVGRLSVLSNVLHGALSRTAIRGWCHQIAPSIEREQALRCLELVGMADFAWRRADRLSGGQSQRVAIARALMQEPRVVIADEPVASLDPKAAEEIMTLFAGLMEKSRITFLFSSHNLQHALRYSVRLLGLCDGSLILDAPAKSQTISSLREIYDPVVTDA
ncbi:MAG TPA: ATP-binding cassette domain-containing protein [Candidatus Binatia bacterium]|jgi:phosphonate transport system ATP-binding protein